MFLKLFTTVIFVTFFASMSLAAKTPLEQTQSFIAAMKSVKTQGDKSYPKIDAFINFDQLTSDTIKPHLKHFNKAQIKTFKPLLEELIRLIAYPQSGDFYSESTFTYQKPIINGDQAYVVMDVFFEKEDLEIELGYFWQMYDGQWLLTDLNFDEDSLVKDYQNQFGRILSKESVDSLNEKLKNKLTEIKKDNAK